MNARWSCLTFHQLHHDSGFRNIQPFHPLNSVYSPRSKLPFDSSTGASHHLDASTDASRSESDDPLRIPPFRTADRRKRGRRTSFLINREPWPSDGWPLWMRISRALKWSTRFRIPDSAASSSFPSSSFSMGWVTLIPAANDPTGTSSSSSSSSSFPCGSVSPPPLPHPPTLPSPPPPSLPTFSMKFHFKMFEKVVEFIVRLQPPKRLLNFRWRRRRGRGRGEEGEENQITPVE